MWWSYPLGAVATHRRAPCSGVLGANGDERIGATSAPETYPTPAGEGLPPAGSVSHAACHDSVT